MVDLKYFKFFVPFFVITSLNLIINQKNYNNEYT